MGQGDTMKRIGILLLLGTFALACASTPYPYGRDLETDLSLKLRSGEEQIERGRPHKLIDGVGHYLFSLPAKLLLIDWRVDNHDISAGTEASLLEYLDANGLCNVKVRLNQYSPGGEWSRLVRNRPVVRRLLGSLRGRGARAHRWVGSFVRRRGSGTSRGRSFGDARMAASKLRYDLPDYSGSRSRRGSKARAAPAASRGVNGGEPGGQETDFGDTYFMTSPRFETGDPRYQWLNRIVAVAEGRVLPNAVEYNVYQLVNG